MYDRTRHGPLSAAPWDPEAARRAIDEIVADAEARFDAEGYWPAHPLDDYVPDGSTGLYFGAAGMIWGLDHLRRARATAAAVDFTPLLAGLLERNRAEFAALTAQFGMEPRRASWLFGDLPILLMMIRAGDPVADALYDRIVGAVDLPVLELMWGAPGAMLACAFADELTGEPRWRELFRLMASRLLADLEDTPDGPLWTQTLYGQAARYLGPVHGFAGNIQALAMGWDWLSDAQHGTVRRAVSGALTANGRRSDDGVNWPPTAPAGAAPSLVQYCHGAAGMVAALADARLLDPEAASLIEAGGRLVWAAGSLAKGSNLCHGTGGNGFALLKLHALTGDGAWLDRARAFAITAIAQCRAARDQYGRGRHSLWTGDIGLAIYLKDCLSPSAKFPTVEVF